MKRKQDEADDAGTSAENREEKKGKDRAYICIPLSNNRPLPVFHASDPSPGAERRPIKIKRWPERARLVSTTSHQPTTFALKRTGPRCREMRPVASEGPAAGPDRIDSRGKIARFGAETASPFDGCLAHGLHNARDAYCTRVHRLRRKPMTHRSSCSSSGIDR